MHPSNGAAKRGVSAPGLGIETVETVLVDEHICGISASGVAGAMHSERPRLAIGTGQVSVHQSVADRRKDRVSDFDINDAGLAGFGVRRYVDGDWIGRRAGDPARGLPPDELVTTI